MSLLLLFDDGGDVETPELPSEITGRLFFAWGNLADACTLSGGGWTTGLPLSNLTNSRYARVARSRDLDPANTQFVADLGQQRVWRAFALANHNLSLDATYRIQAGDDPTFASVDYDSGWKAAWPAVYATEALDWEDENFWSGTYTDAQRQGMKWTLIDRPERYVLGRYLKVEILDANNEASYVQAGRLFLADGWSPSLGMSFDADLAWVDPTDVQQAYGGAEVFSVKPRYRLASFVLNGLEEAEGYAQALEMMRQAGVSGEVLLIWKDDDTERALQRQFLGRLEKLDPLRHPYPDHVSAAFAVRERL